MSEIAAVLVVGPRGRAFVRAELARQIVAEPTISRVPTSNVQMAMVGGRVVSVLSLGEPSGALLVCELEGEPVALSGLRVERVGHFVSDGENIRVEGELLPEIPVRDLIAQAYDPRGVLT
jgi:hypothetical protein